MTLATLFAAGVPALYPSLAQANSGVRCEFVSQPGSAPTEFDKSYEAEAQAFDTKWIVDAKTVQDLDWPYMQRDVAFAEKLRAYEKLGYTVTKIVTAAGVEQTTLRAPPFLEMVRHFNDVMNQEQIPTEDRILPALIFKKSINGQDQFLFVTPGVDPWPHESGYELHYASDGFNLPEKVIMQGLRRGRFPLLDSGHDAAHFASFVLNPTYMRGLRHAVRGLPEVKEGLAFSGRLFRELEILTLAEPSKKEVIRDLLSTPEVKYSAGRLPFSVFRANAERLSLDEVREQSAKIVAVYDSLVRTYGGGAFHSREQLDSIPRLMKGKTGSYEPFLKEIFHKDTPRGRYAHVDKTLMFGPKADLSKLVDLTGFSDKELAQICHNNEAIVSLRWWRYSIKAPELREMLEPLLRDQLARVEYALWTTSQYSVEQWVMQSLARETIDPNSPNAVLDRAVFGF